MAGRRRCGPRQGRATRRDEAMPDRAATGPALLPAVLADHVQARDADQARELGQGATAHDGERGPARLGQGAEPRQRRRLRPRGGAIGPEGRERAVVVQHEQAVGGRRDAAPQGGGDPHGSLPPRRACPHGPPRYLTVTGLVPHFQGAVNRGAGADHG